MAKSNRHKKLRKQEKAKTQLTGVKKLNKAKNVVEPSLRVKKIIIREQLKTSTLPTSEAWNDSASRISTDAASDAGSEAIRRKHNVQELLASSNHHNLNMRKDAIIGLQEITASNGALIIRHLDKLLGRVAALTSDQEGVIRKENLKLATSIISMISDDQLKPYWSMLIAHLKCTMTHLSLAVRYSALSFIELLVDHHPALVNDSSSVLLPCLLALISTTDKSNQSNTPKPKQKNVTRLKTEITGKHDDISVRIKVLCLLSKCLKMSAATDERQICLEESKKFANLPAYLGLRYPFGYSGLNDNLMKVNSSGCHTDRFYSTITADPYSSSFTSDSSRKGNSDEWYTFVTSCITVLIETWVELSPSPEKNEDQGKRGKKGGLSKYPEFGNDKDIKSSFSRRNGMHILNEVNVGNMLSIGVLLEQLLQTNGACTKFMGRSCGTEEVSRLVKDLKRTHGPNLMKYFFGVLPYESVKESKQKEATALNIKLFIIAGKLKMFDNFLGKKLQVFIEGVLAESRNFEESHCKLLLEVLRFLDPQKAKELPSKFLIYAAKSGYHQVVAQFLVDMIHPGKGALAVHHRDKSIQGLLGSLDWKELVAELISRWPINTTQQCEEEPLRLFELLTYIALRRLTDTKFILRTSISRIKDLIFSKSGESVLLESAHRAFVYADSEDIFQNEIANGVILLE